MAFNIAQYMPYISQAAKKYKVSPDQIIGTIMTESSGNPNAQNGSHFGLGQVSPDVFAEMGITDPTQYKDPATNINAIGYYLGKQTKAFGGDPLKGQAAYVVGAKGLNDMMAGRRPWDPQLAPYLTNKNFNNSWDTSTALDKIGAPTSSREKSQQSFERITGLPTQPVPQEDQPFNSADINQTNAQQDQVDPELLARINERYAMMGQQAQANNEALANAGKDDDAVKWQNGIEALAALFADKKPKAPQAQAQLSGGGRSEYAPDAQMIQQLYQKWGAPSQAQYGSYGSMPYQYNTGGQ